MPSSTDPRRLSSTRRAFLLMSSAASLMVPSVLSAAPLSGSQLRQSFTNPPPEARPMVRWWWFGPKLDDAEIVREIKAMKQGGYGGFELAALYPLSLEGNTTYLSDRFLGAVDLANRTGRAEGLRVDVTLGSGWPFGGPHITPELASARVRQINLTAPAGATSVALPDLKAGERVVAAYIGDTADTAARADIASGQIPLTAYDQARRVSVIIQTPTGQQVKRSALGAEGYVLDHMKPAAVQAHLSAVGERLMQAFDGAPPYAIFSDSLEAYGVDWTDDLPEAFAARRGYDLYPHMLKWFEDTPDSAAVRRDWGLTLAELTEERYLKPVNDWATSKATRFRSQTYGHPPVRLSAVRLSELAEGEGADWRIFSRMRWVSSANHLYGKNITSAESWTWLHQGAFQAAPLDIKAEADTLMLQGVNHFIAHGWPYSPPEAEAPGWAMYAAAVFNDHNPWWTVMPEINLYLQRMGWLLRQGEAVPDIAVYLPQDDALAASKPGQVSIDGQLSRMISRALTEQILDAGYSFDYVDDEAIATLGLKHRVLILPAVRRIEPAAYARIEAFVRAGGQVIATGHLPDTGAGLKDAESAAAEVRAISARLFPRGAIQESELGAHLKAITPPDLSGHTPEIGFVHRQLNGSHFYFVANTGNSAVTLPLRFRQGQTGQIWHPTEGTVSAWNGQPVKLSAYESLIFIFGDAANAALTQAQAPSARLSRSLERNWTIAFGDGPKQALSAFGSWADDATHAHYSGLATYSHRLHVSQAEIDAGQTWLDFGEGTPEPKPARRLNGAQAWLSAPVREAAEVFLNGQRVGAIWTSPFRINLKGHLKAGENQLDIRVANTAINLLSGRPPEDYSALNARFGERFQPQNMKDLKPLPSGLLQAPKLTD
ncbi:MAG: glycosyl hydrolase [Asticcacaulis sp.]